MMADLKRIGVLCSGGDSSGMNPCVRAVVRTALYEGLEVRGIIRGYQGLIDGDIIEMDRRSVSNIISRGGTILKTARCDEFRTPEGRKKAIAVLREHGIGGLVVIGGDGSFRGAWALSQESDLQVIGIPGTIDNDIAGTDFTIGYDTAINVATEALDKIRDTAASHDRLFFVEVMGRHAGHLALEAGIAAGAEEILIPETPTRNADVIKKLKEGLARGKTSHIVVVAEGDESGGAYRIAEEIAGEVGIKARVTILGHLQRGGSPTAFERVLASRMGCAAVEALVAGRTAQMIGFIRGQTQLNPLNHSWEAKKPVREDLLKLNRILPT
jgi:6-phosphofructokinase 1